MGLAAPPLIQNWCSIKDLNLCLRVTSAVHRHECLKSQLLQLLDRLMPHVWWAELDSNQRGFPGEVTARHLRPLGHPPKALLHTTSLLRSTDCLASNWWMRKDSNLRSARRLIYSQVDLTSLQLIQNLVPLAGIEPTSDAYKAPASPLMLGGLISCSLLLPLPLSRFAHASTLNSLVFD